MNKKTELALKELSLLKKHNKKMRLAAEKWKNPWETLISIILSARTRDETTIKVAKKLFEKYADAESLSVANPEDVEKIIKSVNYYKTKSRNTINCSRKIFSDYNNKIPQNEKELLKLPGVGRKTANVFLSKMGKDAIGVDTHVSYLSQKIGWTKNKNPREIEKDLQELFPRKYWSKVNSILVRFGKSQSRKKADDLIKRILKEAKQK